MTDFWCTECGSYTSHDPWETHFRPVDVRELAPSPLSEAPSVRVTVMRAVVGVLTRSRLTVSRLRASWRTEGTAPP
jgi:hypothetical protein